MLVITLIRAQLILIIQKKKKKKKGSFTAVFVIIVSKGYIGLANMNAKEMIPSPKCLTDIHVNEYEEKILLFCFCCQWALEIKLNWIDWLESCLPTSTNQCICIRWYGFSLPAREQIGMNRHVHSCFSTIFSTPGWWILQIIWIASEKKQNDITGKWVMVTALQVSQWRTRNWQLNVLLLVVVIWASLCV